MRQFVTEKNLQVAANIINAEVHAGKWDIPRIMLLKQTRISFYITFFFIIYPLTSGLS